MRTIDEIMQEICILKSSRKDTAYIKLNKDMVLIIDIVAINGNELDIAMEVRNINSNDVIKAITCDYDAHEELRKVVEHVCDSFV